MFYVYVFIVEHHHAWLYMYRLNINSGIQVSQACCTTLGSLLMGYIYMCKAGITADGNMVQITKVN